MPNPANRPIIAADIDDVLVPHFQDLIDWYNKKYATQLTLAHNHPKDPRPWGTKTVPEAVKRVHNFFKTPEFLNATPFADAAQVLKELNRKFDLVVVTSRDTIIEEVTRQWLDKNFPALFKAAHFTAVYNLEGKSKSKAKTVKNTGATYFIEDDPERAWETAELGIKVLIFGNYPWNKADKLPPNVVRVKDWQEVLEYFNAEG